MKIDPFVAVGLAIIAFMLLVAFPALWRLQQDTLRAEPILRAIDNFEGLQ